MRGRGLMGEKRGMQEERLGPFWRSQMSIVKPDPKGTPLTKKHIQYNLSAMKTIILAVCFVFLFSSITFALSINDNAPLFSLRDSNNNFFT